MLALIFTAKLPADDHRLELGVVDVRGDDGAAARDFGSHELRLEAFADRDELHLRRDLVSARVVQLRDGSTPAQARPIARETGRCAGDARFADGAFEHPGAAQLRQALARIDPLRSARVVDA